jgi:hypothetical protein
MRAPVSRSRPPSRLPVPRLSAGRATNPDTVLRTPTFQFSPTEEISVGDCTAEGHVASVLVSHSSVASATHVSDPIEECSTSVARLSLTPTMRKPRTAWTM